MRKSLIWLILVLMALSMPLAGLAEEVVNIYNWEDYICEDTLDMFTAETGITVNMMNFTTNEDMLVKVYNSPSSFDVVFPSDYCIERMISENMLAPIDFTKVPNFQYIDPNLRDPAYDPTGAYSVPYMWGTVGILYNKTMVNGPITSWGALFDPQYKNNVFMMDSIRDCLGITLKYLGYSMNTRDPLELNAAKELLIKQKKDGIVKAYQVDETKDKMVAGEAALALVWSGDAQYAISLNPDLAYVVPDEGSNIWVDGMVIPAAAKNKDNAEKFIDYMCRPDIAQLNCNEIWYSTPNTEAIKLMGDGYINNLTMNPSQDIIDRCEFFKDIQDFIQIYNAMWLEIKSA
ncbi:MAG: spermidine/putrescine ABC transporter substrate-binding protein [Candidatus Limiplasma sp.]|nr:spermidine/putrescine ABC transporter substrate-binding protein [Candidatus Limiplasma sp.]